MAKPIEFKAGSLHAMNANLRELDNVRLADALQVMLGGMGEFFAGEPTVIDISQVGQPPARVDWAGLQSLLRRYGLQPVALRGAPETLHDSARRAGLAIVDANPAPTPATPAEAPSEAPPASAESAPRAMIVERTVRSGQQIYARGSDLVILGAVSNGAEVIADGSIHCYGPLRGRALAGASGDKTARVYAGNFGPELVAVAGIFRTFEKGIPAELAGKPAQALLRGDTDNPSLALEALQLD